MTTEADTLDRTARARLRHRLLAVIVAVAAPVIVWVVASAAGARLEVTTPLIGTLTIDLPLIVVSTLPVALAAWGLLAWLERRTARARRTWTIIAVAVLVLSLPPLLLLEATAGTTAVLALMHVAAGMPLILMLRRGARTA